jgi:hypothetical protein
VSDSESSLELFKGCAIDSHSWQWYLHGFRRHPAQMSRCRCQVGSALNDAQLSVESKATQRSTRATVSSYLNLQCVCDRSLRARMALSVVDLPVVIPDSCGQRPHTRKCCFLVSRTWANTLSEIHTSNLSNHPLVSGPCAMPYQFTTSTEQVYDQTIVSVKTAGR